MTNERQITVVTARPSLYELYNNMPLYVPLQPKTHEQRMREKLLEAKRWLTQESPRWKR